MTTKLYWSKELWDQARVSKAYSIEQLEQMVPHRGLRAQTKTEAARLKNLGFNPVFTEIGWSCKIGPITIECEDSTLFITE